MMIDANATFRSIVPYIVLSNVWLLESHERLAKASVCFWTLDKWIHFV